MEKNWKKESGIIEREKNKLVSMFNLKNKEKESKREKEKRK